MPDSNEHQFLLTQKLEQDNQAISAAEEMDSMLATIDAHFFRFVTNPSEKAAFFDLLVGIAEKLEPYSLSKESRVVLPNVLRHFQNVYDASSVTANYELFKNRILPAIDEIVRQINAQLEGKSLGRRLNELAESSKFSKQEYENFKDQLTILRKIISADEKNQLQTEPLLFSRQQGKTGHALFVSSETGLVQNLKAPMNEVLRRIRDERVN